jgi:hypothetical protein
MNETRTAPQPPTEVADRRCWRCLQMFPGDADRAAPVREEFWLCEPCEAILLPSKSAGSLKEKPAA